MSVSAFILCLCRPVFRLRPRGGLITRPRSPTDCVKRLRNWRRGQGPKKGCRAIDEWMNEYEKILNLWKRYKILEPSVESCGERVIMESFMKSC
jgi:hypothetical protein